MEAAALQVTQISESNSGDPHGEHREDRVEKKRPGLQSLTKSVFRPVPGANVCGSCAVSVGILLENGPHVSECLGGGTFAEVHSAKVYSAIEFWRELAVVIGVRYSCPNLILLFLLLSVILSSLSLPK